MDNKQIKELMTAMERSGIKKLTLKEKSGFELHLERHDEVRPHGVEPQQAAPSQGSYSSSHLPSHPSHHHLPHYPSTGYGGGHHLPPHTPHQTGEHGPNKESGSESKSGAADLFVKSPMVGTFYSAPSPDDPPFVKVGDRIDPETVVCIIEAMKVMNEVKAGISGTVAEILVNSSHPVEFGTKLLRVVP